MSNYAVIIKSGKFVIFVNHSQLNIQWLSVVLTTVFIRIRYNCLPKYFDHYHGLLISRISLILKTMFPFNKHAQFEILFRTILLIITFEFLAFRFMGLS